MDNLPFEFVTDNDASTFLLATERGLWKVDGNKKAAVKISKDQYNGKSYKNLSEEMNVGIANEDQYEAIFWNINPKFSPDGNKIVYTSNKDCTSTSGYSVWLYDLNSGEEKILAKSTGENFICDGWLNSNALLFHKSSENHNYYFIVEDSGGISDLALDGEHPEVLSCGGDNVIAYTPNYDDQKELVIAKYDRKDSSLSTVYSGKIDGWLRDTGSFDENSQKFAIKYAPNDNNTLCYLSVVVRRL